MSCYTVHTETQACAVESGEAAESAAPWAPRA